MTDMRQAARMYEHAKHAVAKNEVPSTQFQAQATAAVNPGDYQPGIQVGDHRYRMAYSVYRDWRNADANNTMPFDEWMAQRNATSTQPAAPTGTTGPAMPPSFYPAPSTPGGATPPLSMTPPGPPIEEMPQGWRPTLRN